MKKDKNFRFQKKLTIEFAIPSLSKIIKAIMIIFVFTPWIYLIFKFYRINFLGMIISTMFGPIEGNRQANTPY